jgi:predicted Zn-dependent protease with MMP-like domain
MCEASESAYREEVRITLLHEFGHFLGWNEEDLLERGLE